MISNLPRHKAIIAILIALIGTGGLVVIATNIPSFFVAKDPSGEGSSQLDRDIATLESNVAARPTTTKPYTQLSSLYLQKIRETSAASYYVKIDTLMDTAAALDPTDSDIPAIRASVAMGRHNFREGKKYITEALSLNSEVPAYYGLSGDADIELGNYDEAVSSFQKMVDLRPDFASWSRIAYIRELYGDIPGARIALGEAISSGSSYPENIAWAYVEQGKLLMRNDLSGAKAAYMNALYILPTYIQAMEGLGKVAFAEGNITEAEGQFSNAYAIMPLAQYAIDLGDLYGQQGNTLKASQQYALAQIAFEQSTASGIDTDLEEALFLSDHDLRLPDSLAMALRAYEDRPNIYSADSLGWSLYKNGEYEDAATYADEALELGHNDPLILFHQGMIAKASGNITYAKELLREAYALNPNFSVQYSSVLRSELEMLK